MSIPTEPLETAWEGKWVSVKRQGKWEFASRTRGIRAAVIVAIDDDDHVLLVGQYRVPMQRWSLELPAGLIGDEHDGDTALSTAKRELEEETGYTCDAAEELGEFYASPGMLSESFTLVRATGLRKIGEGGGIDGEDIQVYRVPRSEIPAFVATKRAEGFGVDVKMLIFLAEGWLT